MKGLTSIMDVVYLCLPGLPQITLSNDLCPGLTYAFLFKEIGKPETGLKCVWRNQPWNLTEKVVEKVALNSCGFGVKAELEAQFCEINCEY